VPFVFFAIGALGAGDVKLLAAIGAWVGAKPILIILVMGRDHGGVLAISQALCAATPVAGTRQHSFCWPMNLLKRSQVWHGQGDGNEC